MGNVLLVLCSGLIATIVTIWWQAIHQKKLDKKRIFTILMSKRYEISAEESVEALNMIDVVFYKSDKVRKAWKEFNEVTKAPESDTKNQMISDKHLRLLEVIAEDIGYKEIRWDDIKQYYYPVGLSDRKRDEAVLRRVQIDANLAQIKSHQEQPESSQVDPQADFNNQMLLKALENPDGLLKLFEVAEKAQNFNKSGKSRR
ncbi:MAG: hypothetical protein IJ423_01530 [Clostridia bacterium]|nr:hypothetical protein [Clostridia bacterium]